MNGVASNIIISCTYRGTHKLGARSGHFMPMLVSYSPEASHSIMSPNDAVVTNDIFSTWTQHSNMDTWTDYDRFSSISGLHSEHIDLAMNENLCFIGTPTCNMKTMTSSTTETVRILTSDLHCKLWHHRLGHLGKEATRLASVVCDGIPKLHRHPLFQCSKRVADKSHKH